jgi:hypothetical protein
MNTNAQIAVNEDLDAELAELLSDATTTPTAHDSTVPVAASAEDIDEDDLASVEEEATAAAVRAAAYAEQEADTSGGATDHMTAANDDPKPAKRGSGTSRAPRASRAAGAKASQVLNSAMSEEEQLKVALLTTADVDETAALAEMKDSIDRLAKKVGDKAVNLLRYRAQPKKLQNYTRLGLELLVSQGYADSKTLTKHLQSSGYTIGTARSQANQLMALFPALKIANKAGKTLAPSDESTLLKDFSEAQGA